MDSLLMALLKTETSRAVRVLVYGLIFVLGGGAVAGSLTLMGQLVWNLWSLIDTVVHATVNPDLTVVVIAILALAALVALVFLAMRVWSWMRGFEQRVVSIQNEAAKAGAHAGTHGSTHYQEWAEHDVRSKWDRKRLDRIEGLMELSPMNIKGSPPRLPSKRVAWTDLPEP